MSMPVRRVLKHLALFVLYATVGSLVVVVSVYVRELERRPDLAPWHSVELDAEFSVGRGVEAHNWEEYLLLEDRLFDQLKKRVYVDAADSAWRMYSRFSAGSLADPLGYPRNWNRSLEMPVAEPRGGVLLLHGLSDSPYSLRALAQQLHALGYWVIAPRLPGHGTAPSGLVNATRQDWTAVTRLAARALRERVGTHRPIVLVGYSTGAALAVDYALDVLETGASPAPQGMILVSPAMGVSPAAALAVWQARLGYMLGLDKLAWSDLSPEYDPFKYASFAVNAGDQVYRLTEAVAARLQRRAERDVASDFPRVLAFQSAVDATVPVSLLVERLFMHLPSGDHSLVVFDVNRHAEAQALLAADPLPYVQGMLANDGLPFALTVVTNRSADTNMVAAIGHAAMSSDASRVEPLELQWPVGIMSLSHVALPFRPDDPVYGAEADPAMHGIHLGRIEVRGERGVLSIPAEQITRLRHNPFYPYVERRVMEFVDGLTAVAGNVGESPEPDLAFAPLGR